MMLLSILFFFSIVFANERWKKGVGLHELENFKAMKKIGKFICEDDEIPFSFVNDNYCDCEDGRDEPGTSACATTSRRFFCENLHLNISIPSHKVNDGICDCCDGSDEFDSGVVCAGEYFSKRISGMRSIDNCLLDIQKQLEQLAHLKNIYKNGAVLRDEYVTFASLRNAKAQQQKKLDEIRAQLKIEDAKFRALEKVSMIFYLI
eukprot:Pompholyxophrys_punicea_v1_NODE_469_length_1889_cov_3.664122.p1 type:complete len:205 gc:universal NODE_469_length_1889_cov_3.664122:1365-751(-)